MCRKRKGLIQYHIEIELVTHPVRSWSRYKRWRRPSLSDLASQRPFLCHYRRPLYYKPGHILTIIYQYKRSHRASTKRLIQVNTLNISSQNTIQALQTIYLVDMHPLNVLYMCCAVWTFGQVAVACLND